MIDFATLAKALKAEEFKRVSWIPYQGRTLGGADIVVISLDDEIVAQYKNHTQKNWSHAGDFVLATQFPKAVDKMLCLMRDIVQPHEFMHKDDFYPAVARAVARSELRQGASWPDIVDAAVGCASMLWDEASQQERTAEGIGSTYRVQDDDIVFDLETSAMSPESGEIIAIEAVRIPAKGPATQRFSVLVRPSYPISPAVQELTGITNAMLENQMTFRELAPAFLSFIGNAELFTINSRFDQRFLDNQLLESGFRALAAGRFVDMLPYLPSEHRGRGSQGIVEYAASDQQEKRGLTIEVMEGIYRKLFRPGI